MSKDILLVTSGNEPDVKKTIAGQKSYRLQASMFLIRINDMHSLNSLDLPQHDGLTAKQLEQSSSSDRNDGWTCPVTDELSTTDFTYDNGQLVDVYHSPLNLGIGSDGHDLSQVGHKLNYASTVDSIAQGFDSHSHSFSGNDFNPNTIAKKTPNYIFI